MIKEFQQKQPQIGSQVFVAKDAWVIGDVVLGNRSSVFFGSVLRGDILRIMVGDGTNIQEHCVLHTSHGKNPLVLGREVTVGHRAVLHGCTVKDRSLVGMGAIIMDDVIVEEECIIGAGTVITEGKVIPRRSLVVGSPGRVIRSVSDEEAGHLVYSAAVYMEIAGKMIDGGF